VLRPENLSLEEKVVLSEDETLHAHVNRCGFEPFKNTVDLKMTEEERAEMTSVAEKLKSIEDLLAALVVQVNKPLKLMVVPQDSGQ